MIASDLNSACDTQQIRNLRLDSLPHPAYSPVSYDCRVLRPIRQTQTAKTFSTEEEIKEAVSHKEAVKMLLNDGASVNAVDKKGLTPVDWTGHYGHSKVKDILVKAGHC